MVDPMSAEAVGYHIFILPPEPLASECSSIIRDLAAKYHAPVVQPHTSVLTSVVDFPEEEVCHRAQELASHSQPFILTMDGLDSGNSFFQSFYIRLERSVEVIDLHQRALGSFGMTEEGDYVPHLSLLYGNFPTEVKSILESTVTLPTQREFLAKSLQVYKTQGTADTWIQIAEYQFAPLP